MNLSPKDARSRQIKQFCEERGVRSLVHFTRVENLQGIFREGILPRKTLERFPEDAWPHFNDAVRYDYCTGASCLSISFPNYRMFYSLREKTKDAGARWSVLLLKPDILWKMDCAFCSDNAARRKMVAKSLDKRRDFLSLKEMFTDAPRKKRQSLNIPDHYTTNPQAEVLIFGKISPDYITELHFEDKTAMELCAPLPLNYSFQLDDQYFKPRSDYKHWQSDGDNGDTGGSYDFPSPYDEIGDDGFPF